MLIDIQSNNILDINNKSNKTNVQKVEENKSDGKNFYNKKKTILYKELDHKM